MTEVLSRLILYHLILSVHSRPLTIYNGNGKFFPLVFKLEVNKIRNATLSSLNECLWRRDFLRDNATNIPQKISIPDGTEVIRITTSVIEQTGLFKSTYNSEIINIALLQFDIFSIPTKEAKTSSNRYVFK